MAFAFVVRRCRERYNAARQNAARQNAARQNAARQNAARQNAARQERSEAWRKCGARVTVAQQSTQVPAIKEARPEDCDINAQVLQDVLTRRDRAFQRFLARVKAGETPGYPRFHGANRYNSFTYKQVDEHGGTRLDNGFLVLSKIGRIAVQWSCPVELSSGAVQ
jgi:putative transposase